MIDALLEEILLREGSKDTNNPNDSGGRTKFGISEKWHPEAWRNGPPSRDEAKLIFLNQYVIQPGFPQVKPDYLMEQLVDFGVNSGPMVAIRKLQDILGVNVDGVLGPLTLKFLAKRNPEVLNALLVKSRVLMMARLVQKRPKDLAFLFGWQSRALSFLRF